MIPRRDLWALLFALLFPTLAAWGYFVLLHGRSEMSLAYAISKVIQFGFPLVWVWWVQKQTIRPGWPTRRGLLPGLIFGALVLAGMIWLYHDMLKDSPYLAETSARLWAKLEGMGLDSPAKYWAFGVFLAGLHSLLEEYYWRWFVFGQLRRFVHTSLAIAVSSVGFALHHVIIVAAYIRPEYFWTITLGLSLCVAVGGAVWAWMYHRYGSLYGPWLSHALVDAGLLWIGFDLCRSHFLS
jgi:hypothetical protein